MLKCIEIEETGKLSVNGRLRLNSSPESVFLSANCGAKSKCQTERLDVAILLQKTM